MIDLFHINRKCAQSYFILFLKKEVSHVLKWNSKKENEEKALK